MTNLVSQATVERLPLPDNSINMIFTDPPYQGKYLHVYGWLAHEALRVLKTGGFLMAMAGGMYLNSIYRMFDDAGLTYYWEYYHYSHGDRPVIWPRKTVAPVKPIICYSKGKGTAHHSNIIGCYEDSFADKRYHHWGQDVESARYYIDCFSQEGDIICDPFVGGGTTPTACELINRHCIAFDIDWQALATTKKRLSDGEFPYQNSLWPPHPAIDSQSAIVRPPQELLHFGCEPPHPIESGTSILNCCGDRNNYLRA